MKKRLILLLIFSSLLLTQGCFESQRKAVVKKQFLLDVSRSSAIPPSKNTGILEVQRFGISSPFESRSLIYRVNEVSYESDFYNEFLTSPASIITEEIREWLGKSGIFKNAVLTDSQIRPDYILEGNVLNFYTDFRDAETPVAIVEIQFFLINNTNSQDKFFLNKTYEVTQAAEDNSAEEIIKALSTCLKNILITVESDIRKVVKADK